MFPCAYKSIFGFECPICGFQRSLISLMHGKVNESIGTYSPLIPILILIGFSLIYSLNKKIFKIEFLYGLAIYVLAVIIICYIGKIYERFNLL
jgi:hypothetical protein